MEIAAPLSRPEEALPLLDAGADQLYCGVLSEEWIRQFTTFAPPSRMARRLSNLSSYAQLAQVCSLAHQRHKKVYLTLNAIFTRGQYQLLFEELPQAVDAGIDALILADMGVLLALRDLHLPVELHMGTGGTVFNPQTAFGYQDLGVSGVTLPRQLTLEEITRLTREVAPLKISVFLLNAACRNIDGFCTFQHGFTELHRDGLFDRLIASNLSYHGMRLLQQCPALLAQGFIKSAISRISGDACHLDYRVEITANPPASAREVKAWQRRLAFPAAFIYDLTACGLCALQSLASIPVHGVKIVGRSFSPQKKYTDVKLVRELLDFLSAQAPSAAEFAAWTRAKYKSTYGVDCRQACHYPEVAAEVSG